MTSTSVGVGSVSVMETEAETGAEEEEASAAVAATQLQAEEMAAPLVLEAAAEEVGVWARESVNLRSHWVLGKFHFPPAMRFVKSCFRSWPTSQRRCRSALR